MGRLGKSLTLKQKKAIGELINFDADADVDARYWWALERLTPPKTDWLEAVNTGMDVSAKFLFLVGCVLAVPNFAVSLVSASKAAHTLIPNSVLIPYGTAWNAVESASGFGQASAVFRKRKSHKRTQALNRVCAGISVGASATLASFTTLSVLAQFGVLGVWASPLGALSFALSMISSSVNAWKEVAQSAAKKDPRALLLDRKQKCDALLKAINDLNHLINASDSALQTDCASELKLNHNILLAEKENLIRQYAQMHIQWAALFEKCFGGSADNSGDECKTYQLSNEHTDLTQSLSLQSFGANNREKKLLLANYLLQKRAEEFKYKCWVAFSCTMAAIGTSCAAIGVSLMAFGAACPPIAIAGMAISLLAAGLKMGELLYKLWENVDWGNKVKDTTNEVKSLLHTYAFPTRFLNRQNTDVKQSIAFKLFCYHKNPAQFTATENSETDFTDFSQYIHAKYPTSNAKEKYYDNAMNEFARLVIFSVDLHQKAKKQGGPEWSISQVFDDALYYEALSQKEREEWIKTACRSPTFFKEIQKKLKSKEAEINPLSQKFHVVQKNVKRTTRGSTGWSEAPRSTTSAAKKPSPFPLTRGKTQNPKRVGSKDSLDEQDAGPDGAYGSVSGEDEFDSLDRAGPAR